MGKYNLYFLSYKVSMYCAHLPKPRHLLAVAGVMAVDRVTLPVININLLHSTQHQLQLTLIKVLEPLQRNYFIKAIKKCFGLILNTTCHPPLCHQSATQSPFTVSTNKLSQFKLAIPFTFSCIISFHKSSHCSQLQEAESFLTSL